MSPSIEAAVKGWFSMALLAKKTMSRSEFSEALKVLRHLVIAEGRKLSDAIRVGEEPQDRIEEVGLLDSAQQSLGVLWMKLGKDRPMSPRPARGEPPETRLTGESPTRDEVPAVGAQAAEKQAVKGCSTCKHRNVREEDEPCLSCTWAPDNQYSRYEPITPASK